jgi:hypothetical protein
VYWFSFGWPPIPWNNHFRFCCGPQLDCEPFVVLDNETITLPKWKGATENVGNKQSVPEFPRQGKGKKIGWTLI